MLLHMFGHLHFVTRSSNNNRRIFKTTTTRAIIKKKHTFGFHSRNSSNIVEGLRCKILSSNTNVIKMNYHQKPSSISKRTKIWPTGKPPLRRLIYQLVCKLPLFVLWTMIVIFLLYKLINSDEVDEKISVEPLEFQTSDHLKAKPPLGFGQKSKSEDIVKSFDKISTSDTTFYNNEETNLQSKPTVITNRSFFQLLSTTKKSSTLEYARQSKVFILIIQNENDYVYRKPTKRSSQLTSSTANSINKSNIKNKLIIPNHIRILIDILDSHRIDYNVDSTATGLPTSLFIEQNNNDRKYSVIVIDDFLKYTRLNRWIRDQLDRHCRLNQIGVITYFTSDRIQLTRLSVIGEKWKRSSRSIKDILLNHKNLTSTTYETSTEGLFTDKFPISFNSIDNKLLSCVHKNSTSCLVDYQVNEHSPILRILKRKPNIIIQGPLNNNIPNDIPLISMSSNHVSYEPLTWAKLNPRSVGKTKRSISQDDTYFDTSDYKGDKYLFENNQLEERQVLSMFDHGLFDGIKRIIFGQANYHWVDRILLLDSIEHLSNGKIFTPLERFIQIDIDDIFVGEKGIRMKRDDVRFLIETQRNFSNFFDGSFKFNLGFSGKYFKRGNAEENLGDEELIAKANEFTWFCHSWAHAKAHLFNDSKSIADELRKNLNFAMENKIPIIGYESIYQNNNGSFIENFDFEKINMPPTYAVAPHHSGVYPIHEELYEAWLKVLNVQVTSTEEYPGLKPAHRRRAFVYKTIKVLPRQTCGLYTHTIYRNKYPGGIDKLEASIRGGDLFETILHNPVNIYMSHMSNYANDRLAPYTFNALFEFIQNNTNLVLKYAPTSYMKSVSENNESHLGPAKLAEHYFELYPEEKNPIWNNPCYDKRHLAIWAPKKHKYCSVIPQVLIVGPQKTGTTALYTFLKINPIFKSSQLSPIDFEEIQFFNDKNYHKTVDWYFSRFMFKWEETTNNDHNISRRSNYKNDSYRIYFDKSATYFDDPKVPERAYNLLPEAKIIILLINPTDRAYSWYQHMKAHGDPIANSMTFEQIIMFNEEYISEMNSTQIAIRNLRNRCLHPGYYADHLLRWLDYYPSRRVIIIDAQWFKENPPSTMERLQKILKLNDDEILDYNKMLVYDEDKGFYCRKLFRKQEIRENHGSNTKCLGKGKGRDYPNMDRQTRLYLDTHFLPHNKKLAIILSDIGQPLPPWLDQMTNNLHDRSF